MIPRYSRPEMVAIWSPETRFRIWFEIEAHACDAQAELGVIPKEAARAVWERGRFEIERIDAIEREARAQGVPVSLALAVCAVILRAMPAALPVVTRKCQPT